jgi:hypothetical protein
MSSPSVGKEKRQTEAKKRMALQKSMYGWPEWPLRPSWPCSDCNVDDGADGRGAECRVCIDDVVRLPSGTPFYM